MLRQLQPRPSREIKTAVFSVFQQPPNQPQWEIAPLASLRQGKLVNWRLKYRLSACSRSSSGANSNSNCNSRIRQYGSIPNVYQSFPYTKGQPKEGLRTPRKEARGGAWNDQ